jgi:hypothetical protein
MSSRKDLAAALTEALPETVKVIDHPKDIDAQAGSVRAVVMISRTEIAPAPNQQGSYLQTFEIVVVEPRTDQDGVSEDSLDDITDEVIEALDDLDWLRWSNCSRATYAGTHPAYKFDLTITSQKE